MQITYRTIKRSSAFLVSMLIGLFFIFSAYSKIPTLEQFGWRITETTFLNWTLSEWVARFIIGIEFFLGILFLFHLRLKRLGIPLAILILLVFSLYLLYVIFILKETQNCNCFGDVLSMTPTQSLVKNGFLIVILLLLRSIRFSWSFNQVKAVLIGSFLICLLVPFVLSPPDSIYINNQDPRLNKAIPLSLLYQHAPVPPSIELRKGKHILLFFSLSCTYCKKAAERMRVMKAKNPSIPFYAIMNGRAEELNAFISETRMTNIPYTLFNGGDNFTTLNGSFSLPTIKWVNDTTIERESNYVTLKEGEILRWLKP